MDAEGARAVLAGQFPELALASVDGPRSGTSNDCFRIDGRWIFRFPKDGDAEAELRRELLVLPRLARLCAGVESGNGDGEERANDCPIVPRYVFFGRPSPRFPRPFVGYREIPGSALTRERLEALPDDCQDEAARRLGLFLTRLNDYPLGRLRADEEAAGVAMRQSPIEWFGDGGHGFRRTLAAQLETHRGHAEYPRYRALFDHLLESPGIYATEEALVHGDLSLHHVLWCDERRTVTGIIDFGNLAVGDPFVDFLHLASDYGLPFCQRVLDHYARPTGPLLRRKVEAARKVIENLKDFRRLMGWPSESS